MLSIDFNSPVAIPRQLTSEIIRSIDQGIYQPGDHLPDPMELACRLRIHPEIVREAYQTLQGMKVLDYKPDSQPEILVSSQLQLWEENLEHYRQACVKLTELAIAMNDNRDQTREKILEITNRILDENLGGASS